MLAARRIDVVRHGDTQRETSPHVVERAFDQSSRRVPPFRFSL